MFNENEILIETFRLDNDIKVFYIDASSFPDGVMKAHKSIYDLVPFSPGRKYFGISRPENGVITYKAAAEELQEGEAEKFHCDTLLLKKGKYICLTINDFMNDIPAIGSAFKKLLLYPGIDPEGYCVEWYFNEKDVKCMVRVKDNKNEP